MANVYLNNVTKRFGKVVAVDDLTIQVNQGECFSMLGPSGCGKTTTLRMLAGFEDLDEGEILVGDTLISSRRRNYYLPPEKRNFGMVFQAFAVWPHLNVFHNVSFPLVIKKFAASAIREKTQRALEYTGLLPSRDKYPHELSGGEKQRIALARAIAFNPDLMLLDEPLSNLDPKLREEMRFEIKELQKKLGFTIIYVTHDQAEAMALSDRIMVMRDGKVMQVDTPLNVYKHPANRFVFSFIGLSNFIPTKVVDGQVYVKNALDSGALRCGRPPAAMNGNAVLACRPSDVDFAENGLAGLVKRRAFLGDIVDYRVQVGDTEIRVQKSIRQAFAQERETCRLVFTAYNWYDGN
jgi:iron(III) transport system ATP-binding protein